MTGLVYNPPLDWMPRFEELYEPELRMSPEEWWEVQKHGECAVLLADHRPAARTLGVPMDKLDEELEHEDEAPYRGMSSVMYVHDTTVLPEFQGRGYAEKLCRKFAYHVEALGIHTLIGHATSPAMKRVREKLGAKVAEHPHKNWYGTKREAWFYVQNV